MSDALRRLRAAREGCAHWDYESDGDGHECCTEVQDALREYRKQRRAAERAIPQRP